MNLNVSKLIQTTVSLKFLTVGWNELSIKEVIREIYEFKSVQ